MTAGPVASAAPAPTRLDERVLTAGTTVRFALLVLLLVASSLNLIPGLSEQLLVSQHDLGMQAACMLAAGIDPSLNYQTMVANGMKNDAAYRACDAPYDPNLTWVNLTVVAVLLVVAIGVYWFQPAWRGRRSRVVAMEAVDGTGGIRGQLNELVDAAGLTDRVTRFVVDPAKATAGAVVFGRGRVATVCLYGGLIAVREADERRFRAVVLHELAHIRNRDVGVTNATVAVWRVFLALVLLPAAALDAYDEYQGIGWSLSGASLPGLHVFNAHHDAVLPLIVVAVYLTRASVLRSREIYADVRAVRWRASSAPWDAAPGQIRLGRRRRLRAGFAQAWRTHPSPVLRRQSLTDPRALFALDATTMIITGLTADIIFDEGIPYLGVPDEVLLVAGLVIAIGGIAQWRAVVHAILTGRPVPAGWRTGLWLGLGFAIGELFGPGQESNAGWLPPHPEVVLVFVAVLVLVLVLVMAWIAQNAEWWIRSWRGRWLHPAMLLGLVAPWLVFASILYWWALGGFQLVEGWVYSTSELLKFPDGSTSTGLMGDVDVVLGQLPAGFVPNVGSLWWALPLLWLVPLCVLILRPPAHRPAWLARALPEGDAPLPRQLPDPRRIWRAGVSGALVCCAAMLAIMAYVHPHVPFGTLSSAYMSVRGDWPVLVMSGAMVLTAACVAAATDTAWLLTALIAAGITSVLSLAIVFVLTSTDGYLGPFSILITKCRFIPGPAWRIVNPEIPFPLCTGVFAAGLAAFAGRGARLLWQRRARTRQPTTVPSAPPLALLPPPGYLPLPAGRAARLLGVRVSAILLIAAVAAVMPPIIATSGGGGNATDAQIIQISADASARGLRSQCGPTSEALACLTTSLAQRSHISTRSTQPPRPNPTRSTRRTSRSWMRPAAASPR
jgi:Zn-dependent protease with chaperone function